MEPLFVRLLLLRLLRLLPYGGRWQRRPRRGAPLVAAAAAGEALPPPLPPQEEGGEGEGRASSGSAKTPLCRPPFLLPLPLVPKSALRSKGKGPAKRRS